MKKIALILISLMIFASCGVKKSLVSTTVQKDSTSIKTKDSLIIHQNDSLIIKTRLIEQKPFGVKNEINLNTIDLFKQFYSKQNPYTVYDSTGQTKVESYIDSTNHLKQNITTKPKPIPVTDTVQKTHSDKKETKFTEIEKNKSLIKNTNEVIVKEPNIFQKIWSTVKSFIWFIVIAGIIYVVYKFNIIGLIKKLF